MKICSFMSQRAILRPSFNIIEPLSSCFHGGCCDRADDARSVARHLACRSAPSMPGMMNIHENDVRALGLGRPNGLFAGVRGPDSMEVRRLGQDAV